MYKYFIRPFLFLFPPETAHGLAAFFLRLIVLVPGLSLIIRKIYSVQDPRLERNLFGLTFPNPVGLAAGFDKNATLIDELACLGFGHIEIGTVTPLAQPGNPRPRSFRLSGDDALMNRMGFNNDGAEEVIKKLRNRKTKIIIGGNIGKNKITAYEAAAGDYEKCFEKLFDFVDYFTVNVSSPNTPGLRALQDKEPLLKLLSGLQNLNRKKKKPKPLLLKIAPDLSDLQLDDVIEIVKTLGIDGVVATNTTLSREVLSSDRQKALKLGDGGISGKPLSARATEVIRYLSEKSGNTFPIIGVGGIHSPQDAIDKIKAGATLVQLYTGFIYEGPALVRKINKAILNNNI